MTFKYTKYAKIMTDARKYELFDNIILVTQLIVIYDF